ncbi:unnamed protein product [Dicrocoelium dendriticum]|nr:unnamed protein product [Dicrocoelium dendriticum]
MDAFRHGIACRTQMLELDCRLTKDLQVAVFHDESLDRCTGCPGKISDYTYDSLPCYLQTLPVHFEPGCVCDRTDLPPSPIVLLQDIFEAFPQMPINIDLKVDDDRLVKLVSSLITKYKRERLTVWGSMRRVTTLKCKRANSSVLTYPPPGVVIGYLIAYRIGLLPFLPIPYDCFELPLVSVLRSKRFLESTGWNSFSARIFALVVDFLISSRGLIHHLKLRGIPEGGTLSSQFACTSGG